MLAVYIIFTNTPVRIDTPGRLNSKQSHAHQTYFTGFRFRRADMFYILRAEKRNNQNKIY